MQEALAVDAGDEQIVAGGDVRSIAPGDHLHLGLQNRGYLGGELGLLGCGGLLRGRVLGDLLLEIGDGGCVGAGQVSFVVLGDELAGVVEDLEVKQIGAVGADDYQVIARGGEAREASDLDGRC